MENKKILIVENELIQSQSMSLTLTRKGYNCLVVSAGEEAVDVVHQYQPDIILMDIGLNGKIDGISTAGIIRQQYFRPIIFITEQNNDGVFQQARSTSPQNFINKPYSDDSLLHAVELALDQPLMTPLTAGPFAPLGERVSDGIFVFTGNEYKKVLFWNILALEADKVNTLMYCSGKIIYKISISSNNVVAQLDYPGMVRCSRSHYVNIHRVDSIRNDELCVENRTVPITKSFKEDVLRRIKKLSQK